MATYGFETGDFSNWSTVGNTSVQTTTPLSAPTQGNYQALITNSNAFVSDSNIEQ